MDTPRTDKSETPRTPLCDALVRDPLDSNDTSAWHSLAYRLERENNELRAKLAEAKALIKRQDRYAEAVAGAIDAADATLLAKAKAWEQFVSLQSGDVKLLCNAALRAESAEAAAAKAREALRELQIVAHGDPEPGAECVDWGYVAAIVDAALRGGKDT